jgi:hypothetical protein
MCIVFKAVRKLNQHMHAVNLRFHEAGVTLTDQVITDVRLPERWVDLDGIPDEDVGDAEIYGRTGVLRSTTHQWVDES